MLERLRLRNVGPAPDMELAFRRSVNLLTGDNGLGKTFLMDAAWWVLTGHWPHDVNSRLTVGFPARPGDMESSAKIECGVRGSARRATVSASWSRVQERWLRSSAGEGGLVVYAHMDGSMSVWDPLRNYLGGIENSIPQGIEKRNLRGVDQWPAYVFSESEVWDGLWEELQGRRVPACNGLLFDWSSWIKDRDQSNADAMQAALEALAPGGGETLGAGPVQRLSIQDSRDFPTIRTPYAGTVPILLASAGVRRVCALAYVLTWAWKEHQIAASHFGQDPTDSVVMLFDEVESHLHPRWQRTILGSLRNLGSTLLDSASLQLVVTTHSPLVMASAEAWFDPEQDAWFDLDLEGEPPRAVLRERRYLRHGGAGAWLTSEAFDLATDRGSVEAEAAIVRARALLRDPNPSLAEVMAAHEALRRALPDVDAFWVRWNAFVERCGGTP